MGSHKKKRYESDSSSESDSSENSSSSEEKSNKKRSHKKQKHHSDDSDGEPNTKKKYVEHSDDSDSNKQRHRTSKRSDDNKLKRSEYDDKHRSNDNHRHKSAKKIRENDVGKYKKETHYRDKEYEDREKFRGDRKDDREYNRSRHNHRNRNREYNSNKRETYEDKYKKNGNSRGKRSGSFDHTNAKWGKPENETKPEKKDPTQKDKPNFGLSGKLTEETNTFRGVVIKYSEPPEARKPRRRWRLYPFKGEKALQTLYIHRESGYLIGRERKVVDLPVDHPSCSKQHAALQYRLVPFTRENGSTGKRVRPYLIDLDSANGTYINNKKIEPRKYYELFERDVIKFGYSSREYVLLHENSKDEALDDDVKVEEDDECEVKVKKEN
ncbi:uncharacterized protein LOC130450511 [Diorhabda sublineata]|uniref:uncharacterized protein LOC130450511 n=1 Tax=Diorhabda sublineata TaxID=1163346 RepID=UPI0024E16768|nr:uncharacterized protein LOC130450511 [Diorhabda sublineata]